MLVPLPFLLGTAVDLEDDLFFLDLHVGDDAAVAGLYRGTEFSKLLRNGHLIGGDYAVLELESLFALRKQDAGKDALRLQAANNLNAGLGSHLLGRCRGGSGTQARTGLACWNWQAWMTARGRPT